MASLYCDAGLCKLCPVPKNILLSVTSIPGAFQTADPDGANFLTLVEEGFYVGLVFHRVIPNFMIQAGGYDAELNYQPRDGQVDNESFNGLRNKRYTVAMARLSDPDSADTQFFINVRDNPHLDAQPGEPGYTVFARVVDGMDVIETIELTDTHLRMGMAAVPEQAIVILAAELQQ